MDATPTGKQFKPTIRSPTSESAHDVASVGGQSAGAASLKLNLAKLRVVPGSSAGDAIMNGGCGTVRCECPLCDAVDGTTMDPVYKQKPLKFLQKIDVYCKLACGLTSAAKKGLSWTVIVSL